MYLTKNIKIKIVLFFAKFESPSAVQRALKRGNFKEIPSKETIRRIYIKFKQTGSVDNISSPGRAKKFNEKSFSKIPAIIAKKPESTLSAISSSTNISRSTIHRFLHLDLNLKSYKIRIYQKLYEEDYDRRVQTAEEMLPIIKNPSLLGKVYFSDEATFHVSGYVHKQNCQIWATSKPTEIKEHKDNTPKINVWCAMSADGIIGPYFFEENVNAENYLEMLENFFWPRIRNKKIASEIMFQQDGAPPHYGANVRDWLNKRLPGRWIGRRGPIEWAARSPDLTPLDFFLWGYVKQKVYNKTHKNLDELRASITNVIKSISKETMNKVFLNIQKRLELVIANNGAHIEQYL